MTQRRNYLTGFIALMLAILIISIAVPVAIADDDYLDGGFLGMPAWLYARLDPTIMNNIIGVVHGHTLWGLSEDPPVYTGHPFMGDVDLFPRARHWIF